MGGVKFHTKGQYDQNLTESGLFIIIEFLRKIQN